MRYEYFAEVTRVVDGDTIDVDVDLGLNIHAHVRLRLQGVNTPEVFGVDKESDEFAEGIRAKRFVEAWVEACDRQVVVKTEKDKRGKYGRWIGVVWSRTDEDTQGHCLNDKLRDEGWGD